MPNYPHAKRPGGSSGRNPFNVGLPKAHTGQYITADHINNLAAGIDKITLRSGDGYRVKTNSNGTTLELNYPDQGTNLPKPLYVYVINDKSNASPWQAYISPGLVNQTIPKIGQYYIDQTLTDGNSVMLEITKPSSYILVKATHVAGTFFPNNVEIIINETIPDNTNLIGYYPLAKLTQNTYKSGSKTFVSTTSVQLSYGNLVVNRLKAGTNSATWWWDVYNQNG